MDLRVKIFFLIYQDLPVLTTLVPSVPMETRGYQRQDVTGTTVTTAGRATTPSNTRKSIFIFVLYIILQIAI